MARHRCSTTDQRPQLGEVVLERRAREKQRRHEMHLADGLRDLSLDILEHVALIQHEQSPRDLLDERGAHRRRLEHLVRSHDDVDSLGVARVETDTIEHDAAQALAFRLVG